MNQRSEDNKPGESCNGAPGPSPASGDSAAPSPYDQLYTQYEEALARINSLTLDAEMGRLEFDQVFDAMADASLVIGIDGRILRANAAALSMIGHQRKAAVLGAECRQVLNGSCCTSAPCSLERIQTQGRGFEVELSGRVGQRQGVPLLLTATPLRGLSYELAGIVVQFKDITERKRHDQALLEANAELNRLASIDALTRIANRRAFDTAIATEWRRMFREKRPLSLILCDVDYFKAYNDHYGHPAGDQCLSALARCIQRCLRRPGDLAARYGGEEFAVILADTPPAGALHVAEAIRAAVQAMALAHAHSSVAEVVTISLGIATMVPAGSSDPDCNPLVAEADAALYQAKETGRNRVCCAAPNRPL